MKRFLAVVLAFCCLPIVVCFASCDEEVDSGISYEITAEYIPESRSLFATMKVTYEQKTDAVKEDLRFQLPPNAYRKGALYPAVSSTYHASAYYEGDSYGEIVITSVVGGKGWQVCGDDNNVLVVDLETPVEQGGKVVLDIGFVTRLAQVNHRTGVSEKAVNLGNFFPILCADLGQGFVETPYYCVGDPFLSECADYTVRIKAPKGYVVAATGRLQEEQVLESKKQSVFEAENVRDFAMALSEDFQVLEKRIGKTTAQYYYIDDHKAKERLALIGEALTCFSSAFGEYAYDTYSVVQTGFCMGGMEYPGLTFVAAGLDEKSTLQAIVHETAHQWWYAAVGSDQVHEAWQDEGLTEYSTIYFFEKSPKYGLSKEKLVEGSLTACRAYREVYGSIFGEDGKMSRRLDEYVSEYAYRVLAYDKGVVLFDNLRRSIGDKKFFSALKKYYTAGKYDLVSVGTLKGAFEKAGVDVSGLIDSFLEGKVII
ncbi:MAG: M1 family metallopeptidase [Clostridia bacterium]|nr:M1 family metallopeptidase [Clostridia bacterium]